MCRGDLLRFVNQATDTGATTIRIPARLIGNASEDEVAEARRLCKLNGVRVEIDAKELPGGHVERR